MSFILFFIRQCEGKQDCFDHTVGFKNNLLLLEKVVSFMKNRLTLVMNNYNGVPKIRAITITDTNVLIHI